MSDDFDSLFDTPSAGTTPAAGADKPSAVIPPPLSSTSVAVTSAEAALQADAPPEIWLALYKPGTNVQYEGARHSVSHVHISRKGLYVKLKDKDSVVPADEVNVPLTRVVLPQGAYRPLQSLLAASNPPGPARTK